MEELTLFAQPAVGYVFDGWSGVDEPNKNPTTLRLTNGNMRVTANFKPQTGTTGNNGNVETVTIEGKTWMKRNLNIPTADSWCYENDPNYCAKYGRLYTWEAANIVCPAGWHLPSRDEWDLLAMSVGGQKHDYDWTDWRHDWELAGKKLKTSSGWSSYEWTDDEGNPSGQFIIGNGTDEFGFSALPGGVRNDFDKTFWSVGEAGFWWTGTEDGTNEVYYRSMGYGDYLYEDYAYKSYGLSVRCVAGNSDIGGSNNNTMECDATVPMLALVGPSNAVIDTTQITEFRKWMHLDGGQWSGLIAWDTTKYKDVTVATPRLTKGDGIGVAIDINRVPEPGEYIIIYRVDKPECKGKVPFAETNRILTIVVPVRDIP
jgi:uncharacterized protein (TIGR02145 family)/uncharacterized repeat protein (TIGR02543 family)